MLRVGDGHQCDQLIVQGETFLDGWLQLVDRATGAIDETDWWLLIRSDTPISGAFDLVLRSDLAERITIQTTFG